MSMTNVNEGGIFVDSSTAGTVQVPEYLTQLFPSMNAQNRDIAVAKYSDLGTPIEQVTAIMAECMCGTFVISAAEPGCGSYICLPDLLLASRFPRKEGIQGKLECSTTL